MLMHPLLPKLKQLRLSGIVESLEERAELAREQKLPDCRDSLRCFWMTR